MTKRSLPPTASVAHQAEGDKLVAPAATRNADVICALLTRVAPTTGLALEIASGSGQHVAAFAQTLPGLHWQPTEVDPTRRASIDAYTRDLPNVAPAAALDATAPGWHAAFGGQDLIILINLLHLISWREAEQCISEIGHALGSGGRFVLYGPFKRNGALTSVGDKQFHEALVGQDAEIGYKNDADIADLIQGCGMSLTLVQEMPANNLAFVAEAPVT